MDEWKFFVIFYQTRCIVIDPNKISNKCERKRVNLTGGFGGAMNDGFPLDWETVKDCVTCENSEGYCGYNATAELLCFCNDGSTNSNSCKGMLSLILMHGSGST